MTITPHLKDVAERSIATFLQAFLSIFLVADVSTLKSASVAGVAALLSVTKAWAAKKVGDKSNASLVA